MPPQTSLSRSGLEPPEEVTSEALKGFITGVARVKFPSTTSPNPLPQLISKNPDEQFGSLSLLAHLTLTLPISPRLSAMRSVQIYRNLTPQFKTYIQISAMMLGGCIWAERRVNEYRLFVRRKLRVEEMERRKAELLVGLEE